MALLFTKIYRVKPANKRDIYTQAFAPRQPTDDGDKRFT